MSRATPLQLVLRRYLESFEIATEALDEREYEVFLDCALTKVAREKARHIERDHEEAA